jgi:hypothetical protein
VAWGIQFLVFRKWWTALFRRYVQPLRPFRQPPWPFPPLTDGFWRNAYLLAAAVSFIWAVAMLSGVPAW